MNLTVGLMVYKADLLAGIMSEPVVSVPIEMGHKPAATATAEPEEEPPGFYKGVRQPTGVSLRQGYSYTVSPTRIIITKAPSNISGLCFGRPPQTSRSLQDRT